MIHLFNCCCGVFFPFVPTSSFVAAEEGENGPIELPAEIAAAITNYETAASCFSSALLDCRSLQHTTTGRNQLQRNRNPTKSEAPIHRPERNENWPALTTIIWDWLFIVNKTKDGRLIEVNLLLFSQLCISDPNRKRVYKHQRSLMLWRFKRFHRFGAAIWS